MWPGVLKESEEALIEEKKWRNRFDLCLKNLLTKLDDSLLQSVVNPYLKSSTSSDEKIHSFPRTAGETARRVSNAIQDYVNKNQDSIEEELSPIVSVLSNRVFEETETYEDYCRSRSFWNHG